MSDFSLATLSSLYDQIMKDAPPHPIALLIPEQARFNNLINMQIESLNIPVYRSRYLPVREHGFMPTRAMHKTRAGFKKARNYWRWWNRAVARAELNVGYLFTEEINRRSEEILGFPWVGRFNRTWPL